MLDSVRDRFFDVPRAPANTSAGRVELPVLYRDGTNVLALFRAPLGAVERLLEATGFTPAFVAGGSALVALSLYEYRDTTIGAYNEAGVGAFVRRTAGRAPRFPYTQLLGDPDRRTIGAVLFDLPVTTAGACAAGRELWGFPKFVTPIALTLDGGRVASTIDDPDGAGPIARFEGVLGPGVTIPAMSLLLLSTVGGRAVRTSVHARGAVRAHAAGTTRLRVGPSGHPMAERLRALGLDGARPLVVTTTSRFESRLHAPVPAAPVASR